MVIVLMSCLGIQNDIRSQITLLFSVFMCWCSDNLLAGWLGLLHSLKRVERVNWQRKALVLVFCGETLQRLSQGRIAIFLTFYWLQTTGQSGLNFQRRSWFSIFNPTVRIVTAFTQSLTTETLGALFFTVEYSGLTWQWQHCTWYRRLEAVALQTLFTSADQFFRHNSNFDF